MPRRGDQEVPFEGHQEGLGEENRQEVAREGLREARELPALDAHALHARRGFEGRRGAGRASEQGQESQCAQGDQEEVRGEVQDREEQVVLHQA